MMTKKQEKNREIFFKSLKSSDDFQIKGQLIAKLRLSLPRYKQQKPAVSLGD
ncbi:TPA: hypothetical protein TVS12_001354 [Streptococcus equi subsp. zooepidemicus]|nr:hypothetical protein [Streptococcus equi subsp. zooepidemicus]